MFATPKPQYFTPEEYLEVDLTFPISLLYEDVQLLPENELIEP